MQEIDICIVKKSAS